MASEKDDEFRTLFEPHRRAIVAHCYRMLGSLAEAEELAQESLLRAWQKRGDRASEGSTRAWLYQIATRACLDVLRKDRRRRSLPHLAAAATGPDHEPLWVEPAPDSLFELDGETAPDARVALKESVGLAFVTALQLLSPKQRAALLLVDVLGWKPEETAQRLETTTASVSSLLQRARKNVEVGEVAAPRSAERATPDERALLRRYIEAWESGDLDGFASLLAEDARLSMPPQREHYVGRETIRRFLEGVLRTQPARYRLVPISANGAPAVAIYVSVAGGDYHAAAISVLSIRDHAIAEITRFGMPGLFPRFGIATSLPREAAP